MKKLLAVLVMLIFVNLVNAQSVEQTAVTSIMTVLDGQEVECPPSTNYPESIEYCGAAFSTRAEMRQAVELWASYSSWVPESGWTSEGTRVGAVIMRTYRYIDDYGDPWRARFVIAGDGEVGTIVFLYQSA